MSLNAKALENGQPSPQAELALFTTEFRDKYDIVGDDIIDKKGTVIDTKLNVLNVIQGTVAGGFSSGAGSGTTTPAVYKTVGGVPILEDDKDKMILKLKILREKDIVDFTMPVGVGTNEDDPETAVNIDFGNGIKREVTNLYSGESMEYDPGEYIVKIERIKQIRIEGNQAIRENYEIEILQWGKLQLDTVNIYEGIKINNVSKIYEPEPDKIVVEYKNPLFKEIPEGLFSKKITSEVMSKFVDAPYSNGSSKIEKIPDDLFKNCVNAKDFSNIFIGCKKIKEIPENLFKHNINATKFKYAFAGCESLTNIPEAIIEFGKKLMIKVEMLTKCLHIVLQPQTIIAYQVI
jgi:dockerin type 1